MTERHLIALLAPGSVEAEVSRVQETLFADGGFASALALPPMIPLGFISAGGAERRLDETARKKAGPFVFRSLGLRRENGGLILSLDTRGAWGSLRADPGGWEDGPFAAAEGFILGCWEADAEQKIETEMPSLVFSSCRIARVHISGPREDREWWKELYVEILQSRPLR